MIKKLIAGEKVGGVGSAVLKTAIIVLYYVIVGVLFLMTFLYTEANREQLRELFLCEQAMNQDCNVATQTTFNTLTVVAQVLHASIPVAVVLLFGFDLRTYRRKLSSKISSKH